MSSSCSIIWSTSSLGSSPIVKAAGDTLVPNDRLPSDDPRESNAQPRALRASPNISSTGVRSLAGCTRVESALDVVHRDQAGEQQRREGDRGHQEEHGQPI